MSDNNIDFIRKGKLVYIKQPELQELNYISELWSDEDTMKDVGGIIEFSEAKRMDWFKKMVSPNDQKNFYCLIYNYSNEPVGEISFHRYNKENGVADFNIKIQAKFRGRGYSKDAMKLIFDYFFNEFGGFIIRDEVININGQVTLRKFGFDVISETENKIVFELTKEKYLNILHSIK